jgi:cytochrome c oxidase subunit 2
MNKLLLLVVLILVLGGGLFYFKNNQGAITPTPTLSVISPTKTILGSSQVVEFKMTAKQFAFDPAVINVKLGDQVKITIKSLDVTHGFALPEFGVNETLVPGKETVVEFTADKKGEFPFFCSVVCGSGHSEMTGKLIVE